VLILQGTATHKQDPKPIHRDHGIVDNHRDIRKWAAKILVTSFLAWPWAKTHCLRDPQLITRK